MKSRPVELREDGLLWLINREVFHPRGYALAVDDENGSFTLLGDGSEPFEYGPQTVEKNLLAKIKELMP